MEARTIRLAILATALTVLSTSQSLGASHRTENFIVTAPTPHLAQRIGETAEQYRKELAVEWLGEEMRPWARPCPITATVRPDLGAGGATSFVFHHGEVFGWEMVIQGSEERILDSVLPHEVTHTLFATHFRQPLPRWADEGACTTVEHHSEKLRHQKLLLDFLKTGRGIPMDQMFAMTEYPQNKAEILPLYSQAFSVARYMIQHGGKRKFVAFVEDGLENGDWATATRTHYGYNDLANLQNTWLDWVRNGSPQTRPDSRPPTTAIAASVPEQPATPATFAPLKSSADPNAVASASFATPPRNAEATERLPIDWQAVPTAEKPTSKGTGPATASGTTGPTATAAHGPPRRYQAVRQQPPQRPKQRVLR